MKTLTPKEQKSRDSHNAWVASNRQASRDIANKWSRANSEKRKIQMAKLYLASDKEKRRVDHKKWRDGVHESLADRKRPSRCEVCKRKPNEGRSLHYDHCHKSGLFRGWLCHGCNIALGGAADSPKILSALAAYLVAYKTKPKVKGHKANAQKQYAAKKAANALKTKLKTEKKKGNK